MASVLGLDPPTLLQAVLDDVGVALAVIDHEGNFVFTNHAALKMFGATDHLSVAEWRRRDYKLQDAHGLEIRAGQSPIVRALAGEEVAPHDIRMTLPDGRFKWLHVAAHPFSVLGLTGVLMIVTDETEQVELRRALERLQRIEEFAVLTGGWRTTSTTSFLLCRTTSLSRLVMRAFRRLLAHACKRWPRR